MRKELAELCFCQGWQREVSGLLSWQGQCAV